MSVLKMTEQDLAGKRVLIRQDLNVPLDDNGNITSAKRIDASIPTIKLALEKGAKLMITSHLGRPTEGEYDEKASLAPIVAYLKDKGFNARLAKDYLEGVEVGEGEVVVLDNVRFNKGEKKNEEALAKKYAALCDVFVMDAFGTAHRAQASTHGVAQYAPVACAGPLLAGELEALGKVMDNPARPLVALVGGSKVSTKLQVLDKLADVCDQVIVGGGISNTVVATRGFNVGNSLYEPDLIPEAKKLIEKTDIPTVIDVRVGKNFSADEPAVNKLREDIQDDEEIMDLGEQTAEKFANILKEAKTILWNGPCGVFEFENFSKGTEVVAKAIAESDAFSVAGGGDTLAAIDKYGLGDKISYISTGGGAFLEFVEGKKLPAVAILEERAKG